MFRSEGGDEDHFAIIVGDGDTMPSPLVRLHSQCVTGDVLGSLKCDCGPQLQSAIARMAENGGGILQYLCARRPRYWPDEQDKSLRSARWRT